MKRLWLAGLLLNGTSAAFAASLTYDIVDNMGWRAGMTSVTNVTETYTYDEAADVVTVTVDFGAAQALAPLPPMLALARKHGFPLQFSAPVVDTGRHTRLGPLMGVQNTRSYSYTLPGLGKYVLERPRLGAGSAPAGLQQKLDAEMSKVLSAGHLAPWYVATEVPGGTDNRGEVYWHHPGEVLYFLAEMAPVVSGGAGDALKAYATSERQTYRPEILATVPAHIGARREHCPPSDSVLQVWDNHWMAYRTQAPPPVWNLYGLARYGELLNQPPTAGEMTQITSVVTRGYQNRDWATLFWRAGFAPHYNAVHGANQLFAGLVGYIRLARAANDRNAEELGWGLLARMAALRFAMGKYTQFQLDAGYFTLPGNPQWWVNSQLDSWVGDLMTWNWSRPIDNIRQVHWLDDQRVETWEWSSVGYFQGGQKRDPPAPGHGEYQPHWGQGTAYLLPFADMVPELARFMADYLAPETAAFCQRVQENQPHWYIALPEAILGQEMDVMLPSDGHGQFIARAWVLKEPSETLAGYQDIPWLPKGDFFTMHKLAEIIKAHRGVTWERPNGSVDRQAPASPQSLRRAR